MCVCAATQTKIAYQHALSYLMEMKIKLHEVEYENFQIYGCVLLVAANSYRLCHMVEYSHSICEF